MYDDLNYHRHADQVCKFFQTLLTSHFLDTRSKFEACILLPKNRNYVSHDNMLQV